MIPWPGGEIPRGTMDIVDTPCAPESTQKTLTMQSLLPALSTGWREPKCQQRGHVWEGWSSSGSQILQAGISHTLQLFLEGRGAKCPRSSSKNGPQCQHKAQADEGTASNTSCCLPAIIPKIRFQLTELVPAHFRGRLENRW